MAMGGNSWWIAVLLSICGNLIDATGWTLEKRSHIINSQRDNPKKTSSVSYLCNCKWWQGFLLHTGGSIISAVALGLGDQALLMPLYAITLVFNSLFAYLFLGEKQTKLQIIGTLLIVTGCAFAVAFGPKGDDVGYTAQELVHLLQNAAFLIFVVVYSILVLIVYLMFKFEVLINDTLVMLTQIGISGFFGSWNPLLAKCFIEMLESSFHDAQVAATNSKHWLFYMSVILLLASSIALEYWRQEALKRFNAKYVGSIYGGTAIVGGVLSGAFFFQEFRTMDIGNLMLFGGSVLVSITGIAMLTIFEDKSAKDFEETISIDGDETTTIGSDGHMVDIADSNILEKQPLLVPTNHMHL